MQAFHSLKAVTTSISEVLVKNPRRVHAILQNNHATSIIYLGLGNSSVTTSMGIRLNINGGAYEINSTNPWYEKIYAVATGNATLMVTEVSA